jgi:hypothetical protein
MSNTTTASELIVTDFLSEFFKEYIRKNRFARYSGTGVNKPITVKEGRKKIEIPLVTRLQGDGVSGSNQLRGNGEAIGNFGWELAPTYFRHSVEFDREELEKPNIDLMKAARPLLMNWAMELTRNHMIDGMAGIYDGTTYSNYTSKRSGTAATEGVKDTFLTNNSDRLLFGALKSNLSAADHAASLANIDNTADKLSPGMISLARRIAQEADPHVRPFMVNGDEEWFILFAGGRAFRDLKLDTTMVQAHREAMNRGKSNPLFRDGDLVWDSVIIREIPEITTRLTTNSALSGAGAGGITVEPNFLCGAQALGFGLGQKPRIIIDRDYDYEFQPGVAVELKHDIKKNFFNNVQHGMVTVYTAGVADS